MATSAKNIIAAMKMAMSDSFVVLDPEMRREKLWDVCGVGEVRCTQMLRKCENSSTRYAMYRAEELIFRERERNRIV